MLLYTHDFYLSLVTLMIAYTLQLLKTDELYTCIRFNDKSREHRNVLYSGLGWSV